MAVGPHGHMQSAFDMAHLFVVLIESHLRSLLGVKSHRHDVHHGSKSPECLDS